MFIVVCNNTSVSKEVYKYLAGYEATNGEESEPPQAVPGRYDLFSNYDPVTRQPRRKPPTLLIDSDVLENSGQVDEEFKRVFAPEINRFKEEYAWVHGQGAAECIEDSAILREVVNTVNKRNALGAYIRCVVSVSMVTEGWDANTVTHICGIRKFGSQLLCEQVAGRALPCAAPIPEDDYFSRRFADLLHTDDPEQSELMLRLGEPTLSYPALDERDRRRLQILAYQVDGQHHQTGTGEQFLSRLARAPELRSELGELAGVLQARGNLRFRSIPGLEDVPLCLHASYGIWEVLTAVRLNDGFSLVEAAHLIPFNVNRDDKPTNGVALGQMNRERRGRRTLKPKGENRNPNEQRRRDGATGGLDEPLNREETRKRQG